MAEVRLSDNDQIQRGMLDLWIIIGVLIFYRNFYESLICHF